MMDSEFLCITMNDVPNRVTQEELEALLDSADTEQAILHGKVLVVDYQFPSRAGFSVTGRSAVVDPANFDLEIGWKVCRDNALHQLWQLEGYLRQLELAGLITWNTHSESPNPSQG